MSFSPARTDASGKKPWESSQLPTSPPLVLTSPGKEILTSPVKRNSHKENVNGVADKVINSPENQGKRSFNSAHGSSPKVLFAAKRVCTDSSGKSASRVSATSSQVIETPKEKELSVETIKDEGCWKKYLQKHGLEHLPLCVCIGMMGSLSEKYPQDFPGFFANIVKKPDLVNLCIKCNIDNEFSFFKFIEIIQDKNFNIDNQFIFEQLVDLYPLHTQTILALFRGEVSKNQYYFSNLLLHEPDFSIYLCDVLDRALDHPACLTICQKIFNFKDFSPNVIKCLLSIINATLIHYDKSDFEINESFFDNLEALAHHNPSSIIILANLVENNIQVIDVLFSLDLLNIEDIGLERICTVIRILSTPDFPIGNLYNLISLAEEREVILELLLSSKDKIVKLASLNETEASLFLLNSLSLPMDNSDEFDLWLNQLSGVPYYIQVKLRKLAANGNEAFAKQILERWNKSPRERNLLGATLKVAVENSNVVLASNFYNVFASENRSLGNFYTCLIENEQEYVIDAYEFCRNDSELKELADVALKHFTASSTSSAFFNSLLLLAKSDKERAKKLFVLFSENKLTVPQLLARELLSYCGDCDAAEILLNIPEEAFQIKISAAELKIVIKLWTEGKFSAATVPAFLIKCENALNEYRHSFDDVINNIIQEFNKFSDTTPLSKDTLNYKISSGDFLGRIIIQHCVSNFGTINIDLLYKILASPQIHNNFSEDCILHLKDRVKTLYFEFRLRNEIESLQFEGNQKGPFALLIRASLGLAYDAEVTNVDLIKVVLFSYLHVPIVVQDRCAGVAALDLFFRTNPFQMLDWIKRLIQEEKINCTIDGCELPLFPNIVSDLSILDSKLSISRNHPHLPILLPIARFLKIDQSNITDWYQDAFDHYASTNLQSKKASLELTIRSFVFSLVKTADKYSAVTPELFDQWLFDCTIALTGEIEPLLCRTLQSAILSTDVTKIKTFRRNALNKIRNSLKLYFEDNDLKAAMHEFASAKLWEATTLFFSTAIDDSLVYRNAVHDPKKFDFRNPRAILSENTYNEFMIKFMQDTLDQFAKEKPDIIPNDFQENAAKFMSHWEGIFPCTSSQVISSNSSILTDWTMDSGASVFMLSKLKSVIGDDAVSLQKICNCAKDVKDLVVQYANIFDVTMTRFANKVFGVPGHASTLILNHSSVRDLYNLADANQFFDVHQNNGLKLGQMELSDKDYFEWTSAMRELLPWDVKEVWDAKILHRSEDQRSLMGSRHLIVCSLMEVCGTRNKVLEKFVPKLDRLIYKQLQNTEFGKSHRFLHIANQNILSEGMQSEHWHYALWFNPTSCEWELWEVRSDEKEYFKAPNQIYFNYFSQYRID